MVTYPDKFCIIKIGGAAQPASWPLYIIVNRQEVTYMRILQLVGVHHTRARADWHCILK